MKKPKETVMPPDTFKRTLEKALELTALVSYFKSGGLYFQDLNRMFTGCFGILPRFSPLLDRTRTRCKVTSLRYSLTSGRREIESQQHREQRTSLHHKFPAKSRPDIPERIRVVPFYIPASARTIITFSLVF